MSFTAPEPLELTRTLAKFGERLLFPTLTARAYLAHAAIAPLAASAEAMGLAFMKHLGEAGVATYPVWEAQRRRLARRLAGLLSVAEEEVALTAGTSAGILHLAHALPFREGERMVSFQGEFPANVTPYQKALSRVRGELFFLSAPEPGRADAYARILAEVEVHLKQGVRFIAVSAVQFQTGFAMPISELTALAESYDAYVLVDGIQALGALPCEGRRGHAFAGGAHKWLLGSEGAGLLWISPQLMNILRPTTVSWLSHESPEGFLFEGPGHLRYDRPLKKSARVFETSSQNALGLAVFEGGVALIEALGPENIFAHAQAYFDRVEGEFLRRGFVSERAQDTRARSTLLCLRPPQGRELPRLARQLRERGYLLSSPDGRLRLAPHFANHTGEIPGLLQALDESLA